MELQEKDRKILKRLLVDGREKVSVIAKKTRLSHEIVDYRIARLQRAGIIRRFGALIDESKLGYHMAQVLISISITSRAEEEQTVRILRDSQYTVWVVKCGGAYNFAIELFARDISQLDAIINSFAARLGKRLISYETFIVSYQYKYTYGVGPFAQGIAATGSTQEASYASSVAEVTGIERQLLGLLEADGRMTLVDLSKRLGISPDTVSYHMRKLRQEGILAGVMPQFDLAKLGFQQYIVVITLRDVQMTKNPLKGFVQQHPYIRYCVRHVGRMQLYTLVCAESTEHFHQLLEELQYTHKEIISSVAFYPIFTYYYENLFPKGLQEPAE